MSDQRTHYELLGIAPSADSDGVKRAWKVLVQVWHPDRFSGGMRLEAEQMTARINESYNVLKDEQQRSRYDTQLRDFQRDSAHSSRPSWTGTGRPATAFSHASPSGVFVGGAHATPLQASGGGSVLVGAIEEFKAVAKRYPRGAAALSAGLILLIGFALITAAANRPSMPTGTTSPSLASQSSSPLERSVATDDLSLDAVLEEADSAEALAARREAMQERLRRQMALEEARAMQQIPPANAPSADPSSASIDPDGQSGPDPRGANGGRTIQIMPRTAPR